MTWFRAKTLPKFPYRGQCGRCFDRAWEMGRPWTCAHGWTWLKFMSGMHAVRAR